MKHLKLYEAFINGDENSEELDPLKQSREFKYKGYVIKTYQSSHTQGNFDLYKDRELVKQGYSLEAPYNREAMCHVQYDGRKNSYLKTDNEIKAYVDSIIENVNK